MLTCEDFTASLTDYMEGRTTVGTRMGIVMHSLMCSNCRRYRRQLRVLVRVAGSADSPDSELDAVSNEDELVAAFAQRHEPT